MKLTPSQKDIVIQELKRLSEQVSVIDNETHRVRWYVRKRIGGGIAITAEMEEEGMNEQNINGFCSTFYITKEAALELSAAIQRELGIDDTPS